ncbi:MAG: HAD-IIB family hydrolase [Candidatus Nomurabacteria bacterium]|jgi:HAD superfamily hydrolase (TIGR01484 family)|nr:HAD-IIB family hydrolase [Candidatus Nomurabacteria bacterium]
MKKVLVFDQDDTINSGSKQNIDAEVGKLFVELLGKYELCIVTGTDWETVKRVNPDQLVGITDEKMSHLHVMPTTGTQYWKFIGGEWQRQYAHFFEPEVAQKVMDLLEAAAKKLGYWVELGDDDVIISNRGSQITYSAIGQWADPVAKKAWDPDHKKRSAIIAEIKPSLDKFGLVANYGGSTSVDVAMPGIDKAYAVKELMAANNFAREEVLFIGDMLEPGGNDYPVKEFGVDCIPVKDCNDTAMILRGILAVS